MRRREPPRGPTLHDLLPMWCEDCDEKLETEEKFASHHEDDHSITRRNPNAPEPRPDCSLCNPRSEEEKRPGSVFCEDHDIEDLREKMREHE